MDSSPWRARAGIALLLLGAVMLLVQLIASPTAPPASTARNGPYTFDLKFMGKTLVSIPARAEDLADALRAKALLLALIPLAGGAFLLFLGTPAGVRFARLAREFIREEKEGK